MLVIAFGVVSVLCLLTALFSIVMRDRALDRLNAADEAYVRIRLALHEYQTVLGKAGVWFKCFKDWREPPESGSLFRALDDLGDVLGTGRRESLFQHGELLQVWMDRKDRSKIVALDCTCGWKGDSISAAQSLVSPSGFACPMCGKAVEAKDSANLSHGQQLESEGR